MDILHIYFTSFNFNQKLVLQIRMFNATQMCLETGFCSAISPNFFTQNRIFTIQYNIWQRFRSVCKMSVS